MIKCENCNFFIFTYHVCGFRTHNIINQYLQFYLRMTTCVDKIGIATTEKNYKHFCKLIKA